MLVKDYYFSCFENKQHQTTRNIINLSRILIQPSEQLGQEGVVVLCWLVFMASYGLTNLFSRSNPNFKFCGLKIILYMHSCSINKL